MIKLLIGGSPCTHWSIAQTKNRETTPEGIGWELFLNYLIARDKYTPDYFLYENNKSMSPSVRERIEQTVEHPPASQNGIPTEIETADEHQHEKEVPTITPSKPEADSEPETAH